MTALQCPPPSVWLAKIRQLPPEVQHSELWAAEQNLCTLYPLCRLPLIEMTAGSKLPCGGNNSDPLYSRCHYTCARKQFCLQSFICLLCYTTQPLDFVLRVFTMYNAVQINSRDSSSSQSSCSVVFWLTHCDWMCTLQCSTKPTVSGGLSDYGFFLPIFAYFLPISVLSLGSLGV